MTELAPELKRALGHVDMHMSVERTDDVWKGLVVKRRARIVRRTAGAAALVLLVGGFVFVRGSGGARDDSDAADRALVHKPDKQRKPVVDDGAIRLADGSTIHPEGAETKIDVVKDVATSIAVVVNHGKGRFKVGARADRTFYVTTSNVRITVYAAEFSVTHSPRGTTVYVERGYLDIEYANGPDGFKKRRLNLGESAEFPSQQTASVGPDTTPKTKAQPRNKLVVRTPTPHQLTVTELFKKADAARVAQRPADAIKPLTRVVREFSSDQRAALASFMLGRIYLKELNRPRAAAHAFRRAQQLAPNGAMTEDALAREVESWAAAGQSANAKARASIYLERYPNGHRARAMKNYAE